MAPLRYNKAVSVSPLRGPQRLPMRPKPPSQPSPWQGEGANPWPRDDFVSGEPVITAVRPLKLFRVLSLCGSGNRSGGNAPAACRPARRCGGSPPRRRRGPPGCRSPGPGRSRWPTPSPPRIVHQRAQSFMRGGDATESGVVRPHRQQLWSTKRENTYGFVVVQRCQADHRGATLMPGFLGRLSRSACIKFQA